MRSLLKTALLLLLVLPRVATAQGIRRVTAAPGLDTASVGDWTDGPWRRSVPEIYRSWSDYLKAGRGTPDAASHWVSAERLGLPIYDLTTVVGTGDAGYSATVLDIRPVAADSTDVFVVKTLIARVAGQNQDIEPQAVIRVYAVKENGTWVFANALPRLTTAWLRADVGPISYVINPEGLFDRSHAEDLVAFSDSVAARFAVNRLPPTIYYFANDAEELHRAMGIDWTPGRFTAGYALWSDHILLSGSAGFADSNRHEIVHMLLAPLATDGHTHPIIDEGVATWLGGSHGLVFDELMKQYANYLRGNPTVTVDAVLKGTAADKGWDPTGAALALLVYEKGGFAAVKDLFTSGQSDDQLRAAMTRLLGIPWAEIGTSVRARILALSETN